MPMGDFRDFDECVRWARRQPKIKDPEAYCASIKRKTEGNPGNAGGNQPPGTRAFKRLGKVREAKRRPETIYGIEELRSDHYVVWAKGGPRKSWHKLGSSTSTRKARQKIRRFAGVLED